MLQYQQHDPNGAAAGGGGHYGGSNITTSNSQFCHSASTAATDADLVLTFSTDTDTEELIQAMVMGDEDDGGNHSHTHIYMASQNEMGHVPSALPQYHGATAACNGATAGMGVQAPLEQQSLAQPGEHTHFNANNGSYSGSSGAQELGSWRVQDQQLNAPFHFQAQPYSQQQAAVEGQIGG